MQIYFSNIPSAAFTIVIGIFLISLVLRGRSRKTFAPSVIDVVTRPPMDLKGAFVTTSFDEFRSNAPAVKHMLSAPAVQEISWFEVGQKATRMLWQKTQAPGYSLHGSAGVIQGLADSRLEHVPTQNRGRFFDTRESGGRRRFTGKIWFKESGHFEKLANFGLDLAHLLSAADTQVKLNNIANQLSRISSFQDSERLGELRGIYTSIQRSIEKSAGTAGSYPIDEQLLINLDSLEGRFFESAIQNSKNIRDPLSLSFLEMCITSELAQRRQLSEGLTRITEDLRNAHTVFVLKCVYLRTSGREELIPGCQRCFSKAMQKSLPLYAEKLSYFDPAAAKNLGWEAAPTKELTPLPDPAATTTAQVLAQSHSFEKHITRRATA
jgi:hypothetical protein